MASVSAKPAVDYELVIGLEVHSQLLTASKMFCGCEANYANAAPNTHVCPVCMGYPGVLPVINQRALDTTIMTALALNCEIPDFSKFDRKNYGYPDLPKGYQISQYDRPLSRHGYLAVRIGGEERRFGITRVHLEEDTGRLVHRRVGAETYTLVDLNRAGIPLMEIVSEPDMRTPEEARLYMEKLRQILVYLGVSSGRMEEGALRCDANVSVRPRGEMEFGVKTEIKNMNSFRAVERAIAYEAARQIDVLSAGGTNTQETRGWDEERGITVSQRSKEYASDYRYFPEPDLPPLVVSRQWVDRVRARMPELPDAKHRRFVDEFGLSEYDAEQLTADRPVAEYFESALATKTATDAQRKGTSGAAISGSPSPRGAQGSSAGLRAGAGGEDPSAKSVANWILGELRRLLNADGLDIAASRVTAASLAELVDLIEKGTISNNLAKEVLEKAFASGATPADIVAREGIAQISDAGELAGIVDEVIAENARAVEDYKAGKTASLQFLVGQVMKRTKGRAKPDAVTPLLVAKLGAQ